VKRAFGYLRVSLGMAAGWAESELSYYLEVRRLIEDEAAEA